MNILHPFVTHTPLLGSFTFPPTTTQHYVTHSWLLFLHVWETRIMPEENSICAHTHTHTHIATHEELEERVLPFFRTDAKTKVKVKVKVTLVQALRLCTGRTAHRGSKGIALPFHDHGTRRVWEVSFTPRPVFTSGKNPVPIVQETGWGPRTGLDRWEKSRPHQDSIPGPSSP